MDFMPESTAVTGHDRAQQITTGKRTDRHRPGSSISMVETTSSSYSGQGGCMMSSEEEEDMANCLIMLAQSTVSPVKEDIYCRKTEKLKIRNVTEMTANTGGGNSGFQNYECKTCSRAFPTFQALGGHRASHKKPKLTVDDGNTKREFSKEDQSKLLVVYEANKVITNKSPSPVTPDLIQPAYKNSKPKVHECSICGSEFLSGQALGGHMRRHRTAPPSISPTKAKFSLEVAISRNMNDTSAHHIIEKSPVLPLDLNLPPPEVVDDGHSNFQQPLVFSAAALVDCHY